MKAFEHDHNNGGPAATSQRNSMMWLTAILLSLTAKDILTLLSVAVYFALAAGMNDRLGALIAGTLVLAMLLV
jgi:hypothetical protein